MATAAAPFTPIDHVLEGKIASGTFINVIGIVIGFKAPIPTRKEDYKALIRFYDESIQDDDSKSLTLNIFRAPKAMPSPASGDVVVILRAKVQTYQSELSLMTNFQTDIYVFTASTIPKPPQGAKTALQPFVKKPSRALTEADFGYVSIFYHRVDKDRMPTAAEYHHEVEMSVQVKEKFSLLKDVACGRFANVIAEVVKQPYDLGDKFTLWISDYTEHANFFNFTMKDLDSHARPGPRNSAVGSGATNDDWNGPYGKHSLQITCWEPHAAAIRANNISVGSWVSIRNLQIKYGRNSSNLEGYLRGDQEYHNKINISVFENLDDVDTIDPRLLDTIRRRQDYGREKKKQLQSIREAAHAGQKRRAALEDDSKPRKSNAKARRTEMRQTAKNRAVSVTNPENENSPTPETGASKIKLNSTIKCENEKQPLNTVAELLEQIYFETLVGTDAAKLPLPFINANYRASVRVKNYLPHRLEGFAFAKVKGSIYDVLSDADSETSDDSEDETMDRFVTSEKIVGWEWRFHLLLEDARDPDADPKDEVWVTVDNHAAQCLLDMNACDLRNSKSAVAKLREKLFYLWGDLEEQKSQKLQRKAKAEKQARTDGPPADSDDEGSSAGITPANLPFSCCIKQYGVRMREEDEAKADAGEGRRWQRMYGLFGTQISVPDMVRTE